MSRSVIAAAVCLVILAGCGGTNEPSAPPTSEQALTTATAAPPDVDVETSEAPTSEEPEETEDAVEMDQSEEGAEAFVEHYFDTLNAAHVGDAEASKLRELANDDCRTCTAFADAAETAPFGEPYVRVQSTDAVLLDDKARVEVQLEQVSDEARVESVVTLEWGIDQWHVAGIQAASR